MMVEKNVWEERRNTKTGCWQCLDREILRQGVGNVWIEKENTQNYLPTK